MADKRRRNARPSKYRPRSEAQKQRRREVWEARTEERGRSRDARLEVDLTDRLHALEAALRDHGRDGVHGRRHSRPLDAIADDAERLSVLKARVERLEALWAIDRRKRETRGKIILGGALLAELIDAAAVGEGGLLTTLLDVLDRRVEAVRDRLTIRELLGDAPLPLRPGGDRHDDLEHALKDAAGAQPDLDPLLQSAMADEPFLVPSDVHSDYADLDETWRPQS